MNRLTWAVAGLIAGLGSQALAQPSGRETQAQFVARCQRETIAENPAARRWAGESCKETWGRATAAGPAADGLIALATARTSGPLGPAQFRAAMPTVRWSAKQGAGALGALSVTIDQKAGTVSFGWSAVGEPSPFDVPQALKARGVALARIACQSFGPSEVTTVYRMTVVGQAPLGLSIYDRTAPTASANSTYDVSLDIARPAPTLAALRAKAPNDGWAATCDAG